MLRCAGLQPQSPDSHHSTPTGHLGLLAVAAAEEQALEQQDALAQRARWHPQGGNHPVNWKVAPVRCHALSAATNIAHAGVHRAVSAAAGLLDISGNPGGCPGRDVAQMVQEFAGAAQAYSSSVQAAQQATADLAQVVASALDRQAQLMADAQVANTALQATASALAQMIQQQQQEQQEQE